MEPTQERIVVLPVSLRPRRTGPNWRIVLAALLVPALAFLLVLQLPVYLVPAPLAPPFLLLRAALTWHVWPHNRLGSHNDGFELTPAGGVVLPERAGGGGAEEVPRLVHLVDFGSKSWDALDSCRALHRPAEQGGEWTYRAWDIASAEEFVRSVYPDLLGVYSSYPYDAQRANVLRYLVLSHFGGITLSKSIHCTNDFSPLLNVSFLAAPSETTPGLSPAFMLSAPSHPFWNHVIDNIPQFSDPRDFVPFVGRFPYMHSSVSTGPLFLTAMHLSYRYHWTLKVLPPSASSTFFRTKPAAHGGAPAPLPTALAFAATVVGYTPTIVLLATMVATLGVFLIRTAVVEASRRRDRGIKI